MSFILVFLGYILNRLTPHVYDIVLVKICNSSTQILVGLGSAGGNVHSKLNSLCCAESKVGRIWAAASAFTVYKCI